MRFQRMATSANPAGKGGSGYVKALSAKVDEGIANGNVCLMLDTQVTGVNYDGEKVTGVTGDQCVRRADL